ncbi:LexA family transcriptional regulator [Desulfocurvibacter africanus]|uniref:CI repressor n=1 Tax=Desulfocurvibacter africanus subsp. africanus str. Walvis Bay TaxID=690850 RepID=F3Z2V1_DESAF|nr:S24 family peptidase [Desulfocurvibacter africanus]EGJ50268.1 CI repressor [Desulfocurvibacter africanus subsp. africanus str. Walvis Bay]
MNAQETDLLAQVETFISRAKRMLGARKEADLAAVLEISKSALSQAKKRGSIPANWFRVLRLKGYDVRLLVAGLPDLEFSEAFEEASSKGQVLVTDAVRARKQVLADLVGQAEDGTTYLIEVKGPHGEKAERRLMRNEPLLGLVHGTGEMASRYMADFVSLPIIQPWLSEQDELVLSQDESPQAFRRSWLEKIGDWQKMVILEVPNDDLSPDLHQGDMALVDKGKTAPTMGAMYAIVVDRSLLVRKLAIAQGRPTFVGYMLAKDVEPIPAEGVRVIGRVVFSCRRVK